MCARNPEWVATSPTYRTKLDVTTQKSSLLSPIVTHVQSDLVDEVAQVHETKVT